MANIIERFRAGSERRKVDSELRDLEKDMKGATSSLREAVKTEINVRSFAKQDRHPDDERAIEAAAQKREGAAARHGEILGRINELESLKVELRGHAAKETVHDSSEDSVAAEAAPAEEREERAA